MPLPKLLHTVALLIAMTITASAQNDVFDIKIDINTSGKTVKQVITDIEASKGVVFSYSDNLLPKNRLSKIEEGQSLGMLLSNLLHPNNIDFKLIDGQIVLFESEKEQPMYHISGFVTDKHNSESIINASVYVSDIGVGSISNSYGYFSIQIPEGVHHLKFYSLGYKMVDTVIDVCDDKRLNIKLESVTYQLNEVVIKEANDNFMESALSTIAKLNIAKLKELPNILGEHDALRNLEMMPGMQISEFSTSNICVRGGTGDQTTFLMDEANVYTASHLGGFTSIFNPDVVNHIDIYKNELPASESGALSSVIDVRLKDGNMQEWHTSGSVGLITARAMVEGPLKKDKSSILLAVRRTYADKLFEPFWKNQNFKLKFYFYDINFKFNYIFNPRDRLYVSVYSGADELDHSMYLKWTNNVGTIRWNHIFGDHLFCNYSIIGSYNKSNLSNFHYNGQFKWRSICWDAKTKLDFTHHVSRHINLKYGIQTSYYSLEPFDLESETETTLFKNARIHAQPISNYGIYTDQTYEAGTNLTFNVGFRYSAHNGPTNYQNIKDSTIFYPEWNFTINYKASDKLLFKINTSSKTQPIHQLQVSSYGMTVNRWMPSNSNFMPEKSYNASISAFYEMSDLINISCNIYYRQMRHLIETMQEMRLIYEIDPEKYVYHSSAKVKGCELTANAMFDRLKMSASYDYTDSKWHTQGLNNGNGYPASFIRKHSFNITGTYTLNRRIRMSTAWTIASGNHYTSAIGKYVIDGKTVLLFDQDKINTKRLPNYSRLDISVDIEGKKNGQRRWQSFWNFAIYNVYARKNPLGVAYFSTNTNGETKFKPGYYYFYQFVPSVSYRFEF